MDTEKFKAAYAASRNGTDGWHRNPLYRKFHYSDGVQECAEAGCYWLLDILGTELSTAKFDKRGSHMMIATVGVVDNEATIRGEYHDGDKNPYKRKIDYTDMPDGAWVFYISNDGDGILRCILPTEY